jgi:hypothetical protein
MTRKRGPDGSRWRRARSLAAGAFLAECAARVTVAVILPVNTVVWLSTVLSVGFIGAGILVGGVVAGRIEKLVSAEAGREQRQ